jgi:signal transduction histidine kinase
MRPEKGLNLIQHAVEAAQTPAEILEAAVDHVLQIPWLGLRSSAAAFLLRGQQLRQVVSRNLPPTVEQDCAQLALGQCLCGRVAEAGESIVCAHVDGRHDAYSGMVEHGHVVLPLKWRSQILGVLNFYLTAGQELDEHRTHFLEAVASVVARALGRLDFQSRLAQAERLSSVGLLAAGVAHEIKNPLALVLTSVEWLAEDLPAILENCRTLREQLVDELGATRANALLSNVAVLRDDELLQDLAQCTKNALDGVQRIRTIVRDLGNVSGAEDDELRLVVLSTVAEKAINLAFNEIKHRARLSRDFQQTPDILANEGRLAQVFLNLLINAAQAIDEGDPEGNEIRVRVWHDGDEVFAEVKDTGKGIDPAQLPYVFEPFFTTKERGVGTGLGLYISKKIVVSLRGRLDVESTVGRGTRFVLRIPAADPLAPALPATPGKTRATQS